jgi:hypothetical protein
MNFTRSLTTSVAFFSTETQEDDEESIRNGCAYEVAEIAFNDALKEVRGLMEALIQLKPLPSR